MFNLYGNDRLTEWKRFRDSLETSPSPLSETADFWAKAPFVNSYLDPKNSSKWPDPWHLVLDDRYDDLAIALGIMYTLKLTRRFMNSLFEIHMSMHPQIPSQNYYLSVDRSAIFDISSRKVFDLDNFTIDSAKLIWTEEDNNKYQSKE